MIETHNVSDFDKLLHKVLGSYIEEHKAILNGATKPQKITMQFVCDELQVTKSVLPSLVFSYLVDEYEFLNGSGFNDDEPLKVSDKGKRFWVEGGFYKHI